MTFAVNPQQLSNLTVISGNRCGKVLVTDGFKYQKKSDTTPLVGGVGEKNVVLILHQTDSILMNL